MRRRVSRLVRDTLAFSQKLANHTGAIKYCLCHYNLTKAAVMRHSRASGRPEDGRHGDEMPVSARMTLYWRQTYETDIACVLLASAVAPECAGDGIEDRRLGARDTAPQTEHLGKPTP
jgi:hypothetical protein